MINTPADILTIGAIGVAILAALTPMLRRAYRMRRWRTAVGTILEAWLDDGGGNPKDRRVRLCARYRYTAGGTTFTGERLSFTSPVYRHLGAAERRLAQLKRGKRVEIWYNPANPAEAVLERSISPIYSVAAAIGALFVAEAIATVVIDVLAG